MVHRGVKILATVLWGCRPYSASLRKTLGRQEVMLLICVCSDWWHWAAYLPVQKCHGRRASHRYAEPGSDPRGQLSPQHALYWLHPPTLPRNVSLSPLTTQPLEIITDGTRNVTAQQRVGLSKHRGQHFIIDGINRRLIRCKYWHSLIVGERA